MIRGTQDTHVSDLQEYTSLVTKSLADESFLLMWKRRKMKHIDKFRYCLWSSGVLNNELLEKLPLSSVIAFH